jgi:hypothetical protein
VVSRRDIAIAGVQSLNILDFEEKRRGPTLFANLHRMAGAGFSIHSKFCFSSHGLQYSGDIKQFASGRGKILTATHFGIANALAYKLPRQMIALFKEPIRSLMHSKHILPLSQPWRIGRIMDGTAIAAHLSRRITGG